MTMESRAEDSETVRQTVREAYGQIAEGTRQSCCSAKSSCCGTSSADSLARDLGYSDADLSVLPDGANLGLSCGNPGALAALRIGEVMLDLGSGGGFDVFIAARKVGPTGRAIGVDLTPEMVSKARHNAARFREETGLDNVEFRLGEIEHLPAADASVDVVVSNCVINLSPDKPQVWREVARVLKPGGRVAVSDLSLLQPLPEALLESVAALVGCVAGAVLVSETEAILESVGMTDIVLEPKPGLVDAMTEWSDPLYQEIVAKLPAGTKPSDYVTSLDISARKPGP